MYIQDLLNGTFVDKIASLLDFVPVEVMAVITGLLLIIFGIAIWRAIIGG